MAELKMRGKASSPPNFYVSHVGPECIQLSWDNRSLAGSHPSYIQLAATPSPSGLKLEQRVNFTEGTFALAGLEPNTAYTLLAEVFGNGIKICSYSVGMTTLH
ncbi:Oncosphere antigen B, partial [Taenia solium]